MGATHDHLPAGAPADRLTNQYERGLLGLMMIDPSAIECASIALRPGDFDEPRHGRLFEELVRLDAEGFPDMSPVAVALALDAAGSIGWCGGPDYLGSLVGDELAAPRLRDWLVARVAEESTRRGMARDMGAAVRRAGDRTVPILDVLRDMEESAVARQLAATRGDRPRTMGDITDRIGAGWDAGPSGRRNVPTPWPRLTHYLNGGFAPGSLYTVGGYSGTGKTIVLGQCALHAAWAARRHPERWGIVLYYTYEMSDSELGERFVATVAPVEGRYDHQHGWSESDRPVAEAGLSRLRDLDLWIRDQTVTKEPTVRAIAADARRVARAAGRPIGLIVVDYLGLLEAARTGHPNRQEAVSEITRDLKTMAITLGVPVLTATQLNRNNEADNRCPGTTDVRESSSTIQNSDYVIAHWVPDWGDGERINSEGGTTAVLKIIKGRRGSTGLMVPLTLLLRRTLLAPPAYDPVAPLPQSGLGDYLIDYAGLCDRVPEVPPAGPSRARATKPVVHKAEKAELEAVRLTKAVELLRREHPGKVTRNVIKSWVGKPKNADWANAWFGRGLAVALTRGWLTEARVEERGVLSYNYDLGPGSRLATGQTYGSLQGLGLSDNEERERRLEVDAAAEALRSIRIGHDDPAGPAG